MECAYSLVCVVQVPDGAVVGFTFSFPVNQTAIDAGTLLHWTKKWKTSGVPCHDVMALFREALARKVRCPRDGLACRPRGLCVIHRRVCLRVGRART